MERKIKIFDTTLRDGEQSPGCSMDIAEKLDMAAQLERLGVDIIEAGFAAASPDDFKAVEAISRLIKHCTVASLARARIADIDAAFAAVRNAHRPLIHIFLATSPIHMEYKLKMSPAQVLDAVATSVSYAATLCPNVEFSAEDASRSDKAFLAQVFSTAIQAGATVINVPDTVGYLTPNEMVELLKYLKATVVGIDTVDLSVHCHNDLGQGVANTLAAITAGATQVECTINGIGERAGNAALEEVVMALNTRTDAYHASTNIVTKNIYRTSKRLAAITGVAIPNNKPIIGANAFSHESGVHQHGVLQNPITYEIMTPASIGVSQTTILLGKHSGKHAFQDRLIALGYDPTPDELDGAFVRFKSLADKKKLVTDLDIDALMSNDGHPLASPYVLESFTVTTGSSVISPTATVFISRHGQTYEATATAPGPIDAAFKAIRQIVGTNVSLDSYVIQSVTEGQDALGEVIVRLTYNGQAYTGHSVSIDVLEASIKAYLNGMNKISL